MHPEDERYKQYVGRQLTVPTTDRTITVIADEYVDREFGTGALKITPGGWRLAFKSGVIWPRVGRASCSAARHQGRRGVSLGLGRITLTTLPLPLVSCRPRPQRL